MERLRGKRNVWIIFSCFRLGSRYVGEEGILDVLLVKILIIVLVDNLL